MAGCGDFFFFSLAVGWGEYVLSPSYGKKAVGKAAFPGQEDKQGAGVSGMEKPWLHPWASPSHSTERGPGGCRARPDTPNAFPRAVVWGSQHPAWPHSPSPVPGCPPALTPTRSVAALCSVGLGKALKGGVPGGACPSPPPHLGSGVICGGAPGAPPAARESRSSPAGLHGGAGAEPRCAPPHPTLSLHFGDRGTRWCPRASGHPQRVALCGLGGSQMAPKGAG